MLCKLLGAGALVFLSSLLAVRGSRALREGLAEAEGFLLLLRCIRERISCFHMPMPEILAGFENEALLRSGVLTAARQVGLHAALTAHREHLYLDKEELSLLLEFSAGLGTGYLAEELARCDLAIPRLAAMVDARRESLPRVSRLYRTLLMSASFAVIILLL